MIIVTLTKLLVIRIVANVRSLSSRSFFIFLSVSVLCCSSSLISFGERLKKAISEPLAYPERINNRAASAKAIIVPAVMGCTVTSDEISTKGIIIYKKIFPAGSEPAGIHRRIRKARHLILQMRDLSQSIPRPQRHRSQDQRQSVRLPAPEPFWE